MRRSRLLLQATKRPRVSRPFCRCDVAVGLEAGAHRRAT
ncbi:hypothetical protein LC55x_5061 [Lysobacter capsici]|nr:hypothetical protein LC55x_5061 [Lysobacter capsici]